MIKSAHGVTWNVYLALFMLFTSTTTESLIMENLFSARICTSPEPSINCLWIINRGYSIWSCLKMGKNRDKISGWQNWSSLVRAHTGWLTVSLTEVASQSMIKSAHGVTWNVYLALFMLFTSTTTESLIMENLFSARICTSPEPSINCLWIINRGYSIWSCLKMGKNRDKISGWQNWSSLVRAHTGWLTFLPGFKTAIHFIFNCINWACMSKVITLSCNNGRIVLITGWVFILAQKNASS